MSTSVAEDANAMEKGEAGDHPLQTTDMPIARKGSFFSMLKYTASWLSQSSSTVMAHEPNVIPPTSSHVMKRRKQKAPVIVQKCKFTPRSVAIAYSCT
jgi:hypothetical protein